MEPVNYEILSKTERRIIRLAYVEDQKGLCYFCKNPLSGPPTLKVRLTTINKRLFPQWFFNNPVHLQHNHVTGMTEGAVHAKCNAVLWQYYGR
jgi:hypothetical protein